MTGNQTTAGRILVIRQSDAETSRTGAMLENAGYRVSSTSDFTQAKRWIAKRQPDLLVSDVRLGRYNGLHLVIWGRAFCPGFRSLLIDTRPDAVIVEDAATHGAAYVVSPERTQLLALTTQILESVR